MTQRNADRQVIIRSESKTRGIFSYTKPNLAAALDIFFPEGQEPDAWHDADCDYDQPVTRSDAEQAFEDADECQFYNCDGESTVISADPSANN